MTDHIYQTVHELLHSQKKIVLARIIRRSGSTPRDVGSMCIITEDGKLIGTVGGGLLEHQVHLKAMTLFDTPVSVVYRFKLSSEDLAANGMICGGNADLYLEPLLPENTLTVELFETLAQRIREGRPVTLVTRVADGTGPGSDDLRALFEKQELICGAPGILDPGDVPASTGHACSLKTTGPSGAQVFLESITQKPRILLFGAGHVSACVAPLAASVGFDITVIDDRAEFANSEHFPDADTLLVCDFSDAFSRLTVTSNAYILIITRGHLHDKAVLERSLQTPAAYIGMIGSLKKRNIIYRHLMAGGVLKERLEQVHSPIGLDINAETPEEIAVSIVAELIRFKNPPKEKKQLIL